MQKLKSSLNESLNESLNQRLQAKYPHLELAVLPLSQVKKDNESKRIDSEYFKKTNISLLATLQKYGTLEIQDIATEVTDGIHTTIDYDMNSGINLISASSPQENYFAISNECISLEMHINNPRTAIQENDVIVSTVGTIGNCAVATKFILPANSSRSVGIIRLDKQKYSPFVLSTFLVSKYGRMQTLRKSTGNVQLCLFIHKLKELKIPNFNFNFQLEIERLVKDSHKALEDSKTLYKEAKNLLYESLGLDSKNPLESLMRDTHATTCHTERSEVSKSKGVDFVDTSAFSKPQYDKVLKSRNDENSPSSAEGVRGWINTRNDDIAIKYPHLNISIRQLSQNYGKSGRLDSEYYQSKYDAIERKIKGYKGGYCRLQDLILSYSGGFAFSSDDYLESGDLALIRINNIKNAILDMSNAVYLKSNARDLSPKDKAKRGDILISMSGSIGLSCLIRVNIEAMVNQRILKVSIKDFSGDVLVLLLNSIFCKLQFERIGTGGVQTNISSSDILNILIPKIDSTTQEQIASKIQKSFALRKIAKDLLESAKFKVENEIDSNKKIKEPK